MAELGRYFSAAEFAGASWRRLSADELERARQLVALALDPMREHYGGPLIVTSYLRPWGSWAHRTAHAVDVQPATGDSGDIAGLAQWAAQTLRPGPGRPVQQIIYEAPEGGQHRAHIHIALATDGTPGFLVDADGSERYALVDPNTWDSVAAGVRAGADEGAALWAALAPLALAALALALLLVLV
jgi:hypothetical protein